MAVAVVCGVGWTYLARAAGLLPYGPDVPGALPLQQLAGSDAQPLLRLAVAWIPAGALAGLALRGAGLGTLADVALTAVAAAVLLMVVGAISDAATVSGAVTSHVTGQFTREGTWVAAGLMACGALLVRRRPRAPGGAPSAR